MTLGEIQYRLRNNEQDFTNILELGACVVVCSVTLNSTKNNNDQSTAVIAFCCSLFSHLLSKFQELFNLNPENVDQQNGNQLLSEGNQSVKLASKEADNESSDEEEEETKRAKLRRRKVGSGSSDQEFSEEELFLDTNSEQESEDDEALSDSGFHSAEAKPETLLEIPSGATSLLPVFKLLTDWFQINVQVIQVSSPTMRKMWATFAEILNVFKRSQREVTDQYQSLPLEEDWKLYGLGTMSSIHAQFDFDESPHVPSNILILNSIRIERIIVFGTWLAQQENNNGFQLENGIYRCQCKEASDTKSDVGDKADLMMRNMAHLWLKSEVQELERRLSPQPKRKKKTSIDLSNLSYVYLVPDVSALTEFTHLIKQVIKSQKFIIVVPDIVISEMDQLKVSSILFRSSSICIILDSFFHLTERKFVGSRMHSMVRVLLPHRQSVHQSSTAERTSGHSFVNLP